MEGRCMVQVNVEHFFPDNIKLALQKNPPGAWMAKLPEGCIRLSSGYPAPALVPAEEIKKAADQLIEEEQDLPLHYLGSPRMAGLKKQIQARLEKRDMKVQEDEILITAGACQAIDLIARTLLDEKAVVAVESPTYMEALEIFQNYTSQIITIPVDEDGLQTDVFAALLKKRKQSGLTLPNFLYTIPTFQNPTGTTLVPARRRHLLELAEEFDFLILEDDAYGELSFNKSPQPLKAIDTNGRVFYVGSLSKVVAPGMRVGWIAGTAQFISAFEWFKKDLDHPFAQSTMTAYLENVDFEERLASLQKAYQTKCDTLIHSLEQYFPEPITWYVPEGGYFVWVKIPGVDTSHMLEQALSRGVSYVPGKYFFFNQQEGTEFLRLSFSYADEEEIVKGIQKLGQLFSSIM